MSSLYPFHLQLFQLPSPAQARKKIYWRIPGTGSFLLGKPTTSHRYKNLLAFMLGTPKH
jgi:hypothetical protein